MRKRTLALHLSYFSEKKRYIRCPQDTSRKTSIRKGVENCCLIAWLVTTGTTFSRCDICQKKRSSEWPEVDVSERIHMNWAFIKEQGNMLIVVEAGSGWIEASPTNDRTTQTVNK